MKLYRGASDLAASSPSILSHVPRKVDDLQNSMLLDSFSVEEVGAVVFSMKANKSPGLYGFNPGVFQHYWDVVGPEISQLCISIINSGLIPPSLNETTIVLIPKKSLPESMFDLTPIALCNVIYKIVLKMLANSLKMIWPSLVSTNSNAFVASRNIHDNSVVAYEVMHFFHRKTRGKEGWAALKMDISKAYDHIDWSFLRDIMLTMGFSTRFVDLIMACVSTITYKVLHQGRIVDPIYPECDGSLLFFKATNAKASVVNSIISNYAMASGQLINFSKSLLCFSTNTSPAVHDSITNILHVIEHDNIGNYLGLPTVVGRNKKEVFQFVKDKVWHRLHSWSRHTLSRAGKEILLKTVLQALPNYVMNLFLLPKTLCKELQHTIMAFWWGKGINHERCIHWLGWDRLCYHKSLGGLGFKKLHQFNLAILSKMAWSLVVNPDSLATRLLKAKYYLDSSFFTAPLGSSPSYIWRSIHATQSLICSGLCWHIGTCNQVNIWSNAWLRDPDNGFVTTQPMADSSVQVVADLIYHGSCNAPLINSLFNQWDRALILSIPLSSSRPPYRICWKLESKGIFTVRSAYKSLVWDSRLGGSNDSRLLWKKLWNIRAHRRNDKVWNGKLLTAYQVWQWANFAYHKWQAVQPNILPAASQSLIRPRDWNSSFLAAKNVVLQGNLMVKEAEAIGIKEALNWVLSNGWSRVIIESDALGVIQALKDPFYQDSSSFGLLISYYKSHLSEIDSVIFAHVYRSINGVAHRLARAIHSVSNVGEWIDHPPDFIVQALSEDFY
ncbi:uncharacterized protein LOC110651573 [Hevea brasiliensis]|uniref:uncharacterized protein LOC110651573 n=1 Tax=Hevea brasiliensis TaxID=3981 RepID=UPI0025D72BD9|nr:uncharacterized protein LOC110651573 [Hevea brasiliensis]